MVGVDVEGVASLCSSVLSFCSLLAVELIRVEKRLYGLFTEMEDADSSTTMGSGCCWEAPYIYIYIKQWAQIE